jgi:hypothetical protein
VCCVAGGATSGSSCVHCVRPWLQLMNMHLQDEVLIGMHFRRLLQWFVTPVPASGAWRARRGGGDCSPSVSNHALLLSDADVGTDRDTFEHAGMVLCSVSQVRRARVERRCSPCGCDAAGCVSTAEGGEAHRPGPCSRPAVRSAAAADIAECSP